MNKDNKVSIYPLRKIDLEGGDILHGLKRSDNGYVNFGEVYFSMVKFNAIKAWKLHQSMTLNLVVPIGKVLFVFFLPIENTFEEIIIGEENYQRINVPPGVWCAWKSFQQT